MYAENRFINMLVTHMNCEKGFGRLENLEIVLICVKNAMENSLRG